MKISFTPKPARPSFLTQSTRHASSTPTAPSPDPLFHRIFTEKFTTAAVHRNTIQQSEELVFPEKEHWRDLQTLPNDAFLDYETGRLRKRSDWGNRALIAQRGRGDDFQINEISRNGTIQVYRPRFDEALIADPPQSKTHTILGFRLHCAHVDTVTALTALSQAAAIPVERFHVQQLIDKTTVNTQRCTVAVEDVTRLRSWVSSVNRGDAGPIRVQPLAWTTSHLPFGRHPANYHSVLLRHCKAPIRTIATRTAALQADGFVNYYPQKYFGYGSYGSQFVGLSVVRNDFALALTMLAQDECEAVRNRHPELGTHKGFYVKRLPWLKDLIKCFATPSSDEEEYRAVYMGLPDQLRWKHLLGARCYLWNLCASRRVQESGWGKVAGDVVGEGSSGVSSLSAELFPDGRTLERFRERLPEAAPAKPVGNDAAVHCQEGLRGVMLPLPCGGWAIANHREKQVCRELQVSPGNWNAHFGFAADPVEEHRSVVARCEEMAVHSIPEAHCQQFGIDISLRTDAQVQGVAKFSNASSRLSKDLRHLALSRNVLLGKWARVGHKSHLLGFRADRGTFIQSALREILHLDRPFDGRKSLQNYMQRSRDR